MGAELRLMTGTRRDWLTASGAAVACSAIWATQNIFRLPQVGWLILFVDQLPIWFFWAAAVPAVFAVAARFPLTRSNWPASLLVHIPTALAFSFAQMGFVQIARAGMAKILTAGGIAATSAQINYIQIDAPFLQYLAASWTQYFAVPLIIYLGIAFLYRARSSERQLEARALRERELEASLARSQLDSLKAQLQPHFLFNTLNTVASLMARDVSAARDVITDLSDLLRYSLRDSSKHEIALSSELEFLESYLAIQKARFGDRLRADIRADEPTRDLWVPRMILQPLVENSIRHGMPDGNTPLHIDITAVATDGVLELSVIDDGVGVGAPDIRDGIGLRNTRARLEQLYGNTARIEIGPRHDAKGFRAGVIVPRREIASGLERQ
jgi:two-component system LytT family sensor kinase